MRDRAFRDFVVDQLGGLGQVTAVTMFGEHGLYWRGAIFGIVYHARLYFKTTPDSRQPYVARDMGRFRPDERQTLKRYYEVPADVLEDRALLATWAREALG